MVFGDSTVSVESAPVGEDSFVVDTSPALWPMAGGGPFTGSFVFEDRDGWLGEGNDRGVAASARLLSTGRWGEWAPPCAPVGDSYRPVPRWETAMRCPLLRAFRAVGALCPE